jgi:hypothetical protein
LVEIFYINEPSLFEQDSLQALGSFLDDFIEQAGAQNSELADAISVEGNMACREGADPFYPTEFCIDGAENGAYRNHLERVD